MSESGPIAIVILAAGASSRMGKPKQLLPVDGVPLLQRVVDAARRVGQDSREIKSKASTYVVLGANREEIEKGIDFTGCRVLYNADWLAGMSTSIVAALNYLCAQLPSPAGVLLVMSDQPWVTADHLALLIARHEESALPVVVSSFAPSGSDEKIPGPPAFFAAELFPQLLQLEGDAGARKVVMAHMDRMAAVDFPLGAVDIDTEADYRAAVSAKS